ncbi:MAG: DUF4065 domain-containing protein [Lachnospiraceae bacterium]
MLNKLDKKKNLVKMINMECPLCDKIHEVEERTRIAHLTIKGEEVYYEEQFYVCCNSDDEENEFENNTMTNENLLNARNAYRRKKGLLTSYEIVEIRKEYGLSQIDLARLLGWGDATISRYESKAIQDDAYDSMLRLIMNNPIQALEFLAERKEGFSEEKIHYIRGKIKEKIQGQGREYITRQALLSEYIEFGECSDFNGNTNLNIDKLEAIVSYFAMRIPALYKVKLMKLLWFTDALHYKKTDVAITGLVYCHYAMGALPIGHYALMNLERLNVYEEVSENYNSRFKVLPNNENDFSVLTGTEKEVLEVVAHKFNSFKTQEIVDYMHEEKAYRETKSGEIIPFSLAKDIRIL